jgi:hypothetical protein
MTDTPVTKLDSVERLREKYALAWEEANFQSCPFRMTLGAALTEMWDLSRREALREAAEIADKKAAQHLRGDDGKPHFDRTDLGCLASSISVAIGRLAVEEGTKMTLAQARKLLPRFAAGLGIYAHSVGVLRDAVMQELDSHTSIAPLTARQVAALQLFLKRTEVTR